MQWEPAFLVGLREVLPCLDHGIQGLVIAFLDGLHHGVHGPAEAGSRSLLSTEAGLRQGQAASLPEEKQGLLVAGSGAGRGIT